MLFAILCLDETEIVKECNVDHLMFDVVCKNA